ncbi:CshA/CshB family fibrillar adhesin-related protein [Lysobacter sp. A03]|uniref:CshA/CshB family fibrillar adhesin-related protein n=1 Tax=Lysobacter sp. A03 TaxID=1199154 RepID=UPI0005B6CDD1|nr:CshA/CshB family fibrillar adhesin-related protein [Lysobacter sp. A03]KIQ97671.1 Cell surface protein [Lysobacter sp. A03]
MIAEQVKRSSHSTAHRILVVLAFVLFGWLLTAPAFAATTTCSASTTQGTAPADYETYCWFDMSGYNDVTARSGGGQPFVVSLPGGATLSFTLKVSGNALDARAVPTWTGGAFGNSAFLGISGKPVLYTRNNGSTVTASLSGITVTTNGGSGLPFVFVAADAESTNNGESLRFTTDGDPWSLLAQIAYGAAAAYPVLTGVGTNTVNQVGVAGAVGSYAFATTGNVRNVTAHMVAGGLQGVLFGVKFPSADLSITKSHTGSFSAGFNGSYNIVVRNNGTNATTGITKVVDTLPAGLTYVSASGAGWTCSAVGQVVTCTNPTSLSNGGSLPAITLNVSVALNAPASVENTASVSNPTFDYNPANNVSRDPTVIVGSPEPAKGNKILYLYDNLEMTRIPQSVNSISPAMVPDGDSRDWLMTPVIPAGKSLTLSAGIVTARLLIRKSDPFPNWPADVTAELRSGSTTIASTTISASGGPTQYNFNFTVPETTLTAGDRLVLRIINKSLVSQMAVYQMTAGQGASTLTFNTPTVVNVDSVTVYSAAYPAVATQASYIAGSTVYVRAVISDPFGAFDVSGATIKLTDPSGAVQLVAGPMVEVPGTITPASKTFQYSYTLPAGAKAGSWIASVTGMEGTEGTVTHTRNVGFQVAAAPLTIVKAATVYWDPINKLVNPKAIPGALVTYRITVTSPSGTITDANSMVVSDPIPLNTVLFVNDLPDIAGISPVFFTPGSSTLSLNFNTLADLTDDVDFSSDGGATWTHVPIADANGVDAAVTHIRLKPRGTFAPGNTVQMGFRVRVK